MSVRPHTRRRGALALLHAGLALGLCALPLTAQDGRDAPETRDAPDTQEAPDTRAAPDTQDAQEVTLETQAGRTMVGRVLGDDGKTVEFQTRDGMTLKLHHESLTPMSVYRLKRAAVSDDDAAGLLALAEWCVDQTLYTQARSMYRAALDAGPEMEEQINASLIKARTRAANEVLDRAKGLQADGKQGEARKLLTQLVQELPLEEASKEAAQLLAADHAERQQSASTIHDRDPSDGDDGSRDFSADARAMFELTIKHYQRALDDTHDGLLDKGTGSIKTFEKGLSEIDKARSETKKAVERGKYQPPDLDAALKEIDHKLAEAETDLRLHLCNAYIMRSSYNQAAEVVNQGLAQDPQNQALLDARDRVAMANSNDDFGWGIRPRGR